MYPNAKYYTLSHTEKGSMSLIDISSCPDDLPGFFSRQLCKSYQLEHTLLPLQILFHAECSFHKALPLLSVCGNNAAGLQERPPRSLRPCGRCPGQRQPTGFRPQLEFRQDQSALLYRELGPATIDHLALHYMQRKSGRYPSVDSLDSFLRQRGLKESQVGRQESYWSEQCRGYRDIIRA